MQNSVLQTELEGRVWSGRIEVHIHVGFLILHWYFIIGLALGSCCSDLSHCNFRLMISLRKYN